MLFNMVKVRANSVKPTMKCTSNAGIARASLAPLYTGIYYKPLLDYTLAVKTTRTKHSKRESTNES